MILNLDTIAWENLVMTLLHSLWQAALGAIAVWVLLRGIPARRANFRYAIAVGGMLALLVSTMATFQVISGAEQKSEIAIASEIKPAARSPVVDTIAAEPVSFSTGQSVQAQPLDERQSSKTLRANAWTWAAGIWLLGTALMLARAAWLVRGATRLRRACHVVSDGPLAIALEQLRQTMRIARRIRIAAGDHVRVPAVFGIVWPIVLVPVAMANDMSVAQMRMILAHELAHVRRHDYLVNLLQLLIEAVLFFNPAVWWMSRQIRIEREACCDAIAVRVTGGSETDYVQTLADAVSRLLGARQPGLALTPAASGQGGLVDRATRVLKPSHRPAVRLSWYSLAAATLVAAVLLAGMWRGTQAAVEVAQRLLTPQQRVEKIAELQEQLTASQLRPSREPVQNAELTGTVRTADGAPLPSGTVVSVLARYRGGTASYSVPIDAQGHFKYSVNEGIAQARIEAVGYAPAFSPLLRSAADEQGKRSYPPVNLVLTKGFSGVVRLLSTEGARPVAGAAVSLAYQLDHNEVSFGAHWHSVSDADGRVTVPHAIDRAAQMTIECAGYQFDRVAVRLTEDRPSEIKVRPARPTSGVVLDAATRQPIAGATISVVSRKGFASQTWYPNPDSTAVPPPLLGKADAAGRFVLDTLRDDTIYTLWVSASGHGSSLLPNVRAGQQELQWTLGPSRAIQIEVRAGDDGDIPKRVTVSNPLRLGDESYSHQFDLKLAIENGVGKAELTDPIPGTARLQAGDAKVSVNVPLTHGNDPVVLDLRRVAEAKKQQPMREVVIKLNWPSDGAEPKGRLRVDYIKPDQRNSYFPDMLELKNGEARINVPVPTNFGYSQGEVAGYWLDSKHEIAIPPGEGPFVLNVQATPAGALHGLLTDEKGEPFSDYFYVSLEVVKPSPELTNRRQPSMQQPYNSRDAGGRFLLSPLPFDGTYRVFAAAGARFAMSEEITLESANPIREVNLKFAKGIPLQGQIVGPGDQPVETADVQLLFNSGRGSHGTNTKTDRDGRFTFEHVDPRAGAYELTFAPGHSTQGIRVSPVVPNGKPLEIKVPAGLTSRGRLIGISHVHAHPPTMAGLKVVLRPRVPGSAKYPHSIEAMTNDLGEFEFAGLEPIEYRIDIPGTYPPDATLTRDEDGNVKGVRVVGTEKIQTLTGGQSEAVELKRIR